MVAGRTVIDLKSQMYCDGLWQRWGWIEMTDRSERREEIKLVLEYLKLVISVGGIVTLYFALRQWEAATNAANIAVYQRMTGE